MGKKILKTTLLIGAVLCFSVMTIAQDAKPTAYAILVDNTGSMRPQLERVVAIAKEVVKQTKAGSSFSLFGFATDPSPAKRGALIAAGVECTMQSDEVSKQLDRIFVAVGQTTLFDAMKTAADRLDSQKPSKCGDFAERNLVVISDGEDRNSTITQADLIKTLKQNGTRVLFVALTDDLSSEWGFTGKSPMHIVKDFGKKLVKETGGTVVFPKKKQTPQEVVKELFTIKTDIK